MTTRPAPRGVTRSRAVNDLIAERNRRLRAATTDEQRTSVIAMYDQLIEQQRELERRGGCGMTANMTPQQIAQAWSDLTDAERAEKVASVTPCTRPGYVDHDGRPLWIGDVAATTHGQTYDAYRAFGGPSGFSGTGNAIIDSATGEVLAREAFRFDALRAQRRIELERQTPPSDPSAVLATGGRS